MTVATFRFASIGTGDPRRFFKEGDSPRPEDQGSAARSGSRSRLDTTTPKDRSANGTSAFWNIDRFVLCGDKTQDGAELLTFPAVAPLSFAPSVVPDTSRAVPYPAIATVTIHAANHGTNVVEFANSTSEYLQPTQAVDPAAGRDKSGQRRKAGFDGGHRVSTRRFLFSIKSGHCPTPLPATAGCLPWLRFKRPMLSPRN